MTELALVYLAQGRLTEAEKLGIQVLNISKKEFDVGHIQTMTCMVILAKTWESQSQSYGEWKIALVVTKGHLALTILILGLPRSY